eukprot:gene9846-10005_t
MIIENRKFGLRLWLLVLGPQPFRAYLYRSGLVLFSGEQYNADLSAVGDLAAAPQDEPEYFFWNEITGEVQWEDPGDVAFEDDAGIRFWLGSAGEKLSEEPQGLAYSWVEYYSEDLQRAYYFNQDTKETTWTRPDDLAWRRVPVKKQRS